MVLTQPRSGAEVVFRSFITPLFGRYFTASTASGLRARAEGFAKAE